MALSIGIEAPDFALIASDGTEWRLSDHRGRVRVLLFYPKNETLVCTKQLCSVRDNWQDYLATNAEILGISPSTPEENREFALSRQLPMTLLADPGRGITAVYAKHPVFPLFATRGIVVIDAEGHIRTSMVMLRAFRPRDTDVLRAIYKARGDLLEDRYKDITSRLNKIKATKG